MTNGAGPIFVAVRRISPKIAATTTITLMESNCFTSVALNFRVAKAQFPRISVLAALPVVVTSVFPSGLKPSQALACGCVQPLPRVDRSFSTLNLEVRLDNVMILIQ